MVPAKRINTLTARGVLQWLSLCRSPRGTNVSSNDWLNVCFREDVCTDVNQFKKQLFTVNSQR